MKTLSKLLKIAVLLTTISLVVGCNQSSTNRATGIVGTGAYTYNTAGQCVVNGTSQVVDSYYCQYSSTNTGYQYINGQCMQTSTGQIVTPTLCTSAYGGASQQCNGVYYVWNQYAWQQVQCVSTGYTSNCSGYTVYPSGATSQAQGIRCM